MDDTTETDSGQVEGASDRDKEMMEVTGTLEDYKKKTGREIKFIPKTHHSAAKPAEVVVETSTMAGLGLKPAVLLDEEEIPRPEPSLKVETGGGAGHSLEDPPAPPVENEGEQQSDLTSEEIEILEQSAEEQTVEGDRLLAEAGRAERDPDTGDFTNKGSAEKKRLETAAKAAFAKAGLNLDKISDPDHKRLAASMYERAGLAREQAAALLSTGEEADLYNALIVLYREDSPQARAMGQEALGKLSPDVRDRILNKIKDDVRWEREWAELFANRGEDTQEKLMDLMRRQGQEALPQFGGMGGRDKDLPKIPTEDDLTLTLEQNEAAKEKAIQGQKEWVYTTLMRIARTGKPFGAQESYMDAIKISQNRAFIDKDVLTEMDSLILLYNQYVASSNAGEYGEWTQGSNAFRAEHLNTLDHIPELAVSFRLWERASQGMKVEASVLREDLGWSDSDSTHLAEDSVLKLRGDKLEKRRTQIENTVKTILSSTWAKRVGAVDGAEVDQEREDRLSKFALMFGEFDWKVRERAAYQDSKRNGTEANGAGDIPVRRLFHLDEVLVGGVKDGRVHSTFEVIKVAKLHQKDWTSELSEEDFWLKQDDPDNRLKNYPYLKETPKQWYLRMKRDEKVDMEGNILDMSECPLELIDYSLAAKGPHAAIFASHVNIQMGGAEETRKLFVESGGILENATMENFENFAKKGAFKNLNYRLDEEEADKGELGKGKVKWSLEWKKDRAKTLEVRDAKRRKFHDPNVPAEDKEVSETFRQEAFLDVFKMVAKNSKDRKAASPETMAHMAERAAGHALSVFGKKERREALDYLFTVNLPGPLKALNRIAPYWIQIPFRELKGKVGGSILATIMKFFQSIVSTK